MSFFHKKASISENITEKFEKKAPIWLHLPPSSTDTDETKFRKKHKILNFYTNAAVLLYSLANNLSILHR